MGVSGPWTSADNDQGGYGEMYLPKDLIQMAGWRRISTNSHNLEHQRSVSSATLDNGMFLLLGNPVMIMMVPGMVSLDNFIILA